MIEKGVTSTNKKQQCWLDRWIQKDKFVSLIIFQCHSDLSMGNRVI